MSVQHNNCTHKEALSPSTSELQTIFNESTQIFFLQTSCIVQILTQFWQHLKGRFLLLNVIIFISIHLSFTFSRLMQHSQALLHLFHFIQLSLGNICKSFPQPCFPLSQEKNIFIILMCMCYLCNLFKSVDFTSSDMGSAGAGSSVADPASTASCRSPCRFCWYLLFCLLPSAMMSTFENRQH